MNPDLAAIGIALGLGMLVGLQREQLQSRIAGIRTFSLITLFGTLTAILAGHLDIEWIVAAGILALAVLLAAANILKQGGRNPDPGQTTEMAALVMYMVGVYLVLGDMAIGVVVGALVAILLYLKQFFRDQVSRLGDKDFRAIMVFVGVSLVILPLLPDRTFGPFDVLNYRQIWLMVVLIVGISVAGYFAYKILGKKVGTGINGVLGGLISSTATTATYSRQAKESAQITPISVFVITAAAAVAFVRVLIEIAVVAPGSMMTVGPPLGIVLVVAIAVSAVLYFRSTVTSDEPVPEPRNPAQFRTALTFGVLYAVVLLLVAYAKHAMGTGGLYVVSVLSGLTDMDAITLSIANMMQTDRLDALEAWRYILVAGMANLVFKAGIVLILGNRKLFRYVAMAFSVIIAAGLIVLFLW